MLSFYKTFVVQSQSEMSKTSERGRSVTTTFYATGISDYRERERESRSELNLSAEMLSQGGAEAGAWKAKRVRPSPLSNFL